MAGEAAEGTASLKGRLELDKRIVQKKPMRAVFIEILNEANKVAQGWIRVEMWLDLEILLRLYSPVHQVHQLVIQ